MKTFFLETYLPGQCRDQNLHLKTRPSNVNVSLMTVLDKLWTKLHMEVFPVVFWGTLPRVVDQIGSASWTKGAGTRG